MAGTTTNTSSDCYLHALLHPKDSDCNLEKTISPVSSDRLLRDTVQPNERTILSAKVVIDLKNVGVHAVLQRCHLAKVGIEALVVPVKNSAYPFECSDLSEATVIVFCSSATDFPAFLPSSTFPVSSSI